MRSLDELTPPDAEISALPKKRWPQGATVGLLLVAAACAGTAVALYLAAGPRDVFTP